MYVKLKLFEDDYGNRHTYIPTYIHTYEHDCIKCFIRICDDFLRENMIFFLHLMIFRKASGNAGIMKLVQQDILHSPLVELYR